MIPLLLVLLAMVALRHAHNLTHEGDTLMSWAYTAIGVSAIVFAAVERGA